MNFFLGIFQGFCLKLQRPSFTEHRIVHFSKSEQVVHGLFKIIQNCVSSKLTIKNI